MNVRPQLSRRGRHLLGVLLVLVSVVTGFLAVVRTSDSPTAGTWPRPFDPAKPFNMLGVPGVSVEQRKRAEDLLVRSLEAAPLWGDYRKVVAAGWFPIETAASGGYEHVINPALVDDGYVLDPRYPESLVYQLRDGERIFVAYMFMADNGVGLGDDALEDFAGRLIEWHVHRNACFLPVEGSPLGRIAGFAEEDGSCAVQGASTRTGGGTAAGGSQPLAMTHVWVTSRACGPFSTIAGGAEGDTLTPRNDRVDLCEH